MAALPSIISAWGEIVFFKDIFTFHMYCYDLHRITHLSEKCNPDYNSIVLAVCKEFLRYLLIFP
jgi:hypothetical protein